MPDGTHSLRPAAQRGGFPQAGQRNRELSPMTIRIHGQSRRYSPRPHPPSAPGRKIRRNCPASVLSLPAPGGSSLPRLYPILRYLTTFSHGPQGFFSGNRTKIYACLFFPVVVSYNAVPAAALCGFPSWGEKRSNLAREAGTEYAMTGKITERRSRKPDCGTWTTFKEQGKRPGERNPAHDAASREGGPTAASRPRRSVCSPVSRCGDTAGPLPLSGKRVRVLP